MCGSCDARHAHTSLIIRSRTRLRGRPSACAIIISIRSGESACTGLAWPSRLCEPARKASSQRSGWLSSGARTPQNVLSPRPVGEGCATALRQGQDVLGFCVPLVPVGDEQRVARHRQAPEAVPVRADGFGIAQPPPPSPAYLREGGGWDPHPSPVSCRLLLSVRPHTRVGRVCPRIFALRSVPTAAHREPPVAILLQLYLQRCRRAQDAQVARGVRHARKVAAPTNRRRPDGLLRPQSVAGICRAHSHDPAAGGRGALGE